MKSGRATSRRFTRAAAGEAAASVRHIGRHSGDESVDHGRHTFPYMELHLLGCRTVGEFQSDPFSGSVKDNLVAALAILHAAAGLQLLPYKRGARGLHFHKEDPNTTHKSCPGKNIVKADLIKAVQTEIERRNSGEHPADEGGNFGVVKTAPDNPLNLRAKPSADSSIVAKLNNGAKVTVLGGRNIGSSRWLNVTAAGKSGWAAANYVDIT
jgi:Bacterial SH3 domain